MNARDILMAHGRGIYKENQTNGDFTVDSYHEKVRGFVEVADNMWIIEMPIPEDEDSLDQVYVDLDTAEESDEESNGVTLTWENNRGLIIEWVNLLKANWTEQSPIALWDFPSE